MKPHPCRTLVHCCRPAAASAVLAWLGWAAATASADPVWENLGYTLFRDMQGVSASGASTWLPIPTHPDSPTGQAYKLRGVVLNNPGDMVNSAADYREGPMFAMGGQWQVYVQWIDNPAVSYDDNDFGGAAVWMGQNYGNHPWHWQNWTYNYGNAEWTAEVNRVGLNGTLQAGDLIEVRARGGLFYNGKLNVNEQHDNYPDFNFDIVYLGHPGLPAATPITLDQIKNPDDTFRFSQDRTLPSNPERYQATLVELQNVRLLNPVDFLANDAAYTLVDAAGLTLPMKLGIGGFDGLPAPQGYFDVVGIFDQESSNYTSGYRLWVMDAGQLAAAVPEPASAGLATAGAAALLAFGLRRRRRRSV